MGKSPPQLKEFAIKSVTIFESYLKKYNFKRIKKKTEEHSFTMIYGREDSYIKIHASMYPQDYPYYYTIRLGEGSQEWPEQDWNSISLDQLISYIDPQAKVEERSLFELEKIEQSLQNAKDELEKYGETYLKGNLSLFKTARAKINREREPIKIYEPTGNGQYTVHIDPVSTALKEKYT